MKFIISSLTLIQNHVKYVQNQFTSIKLLSNEQKKNGTDNITHVLKTKHTNVFSYSSEINFLIDQFDIGINQIITIITNSNLSIL